MTLCKSSTSIFFPIQQFASRIPSRYWVSRYGAQLMGFRMHIFKLLRGKTKIDEIFYRNYKSLMIRSFLEENCCQQSSISRLERITSALLGLMGSKLGALLESLNNIVLCCLQVFFEGPHDAERHHPLGQLYAQWLHSFLAVPHWIPSGAITSGLGVKLAQKLRNSQKYHPSAAFFPKMQLISTTVITTGVIPEKKNRK